MLPQGGGENCPKSYSIRATFRSGKNPDSTSQLGRLEILTSALRPNRNVFLIEQKSFTQRLMIFALDRQRRVGVCDTSFG
jgi:hypothetical protein